VRCRYAHTNLVARDWRLLAAFYADVFGCEPLPPERDLRGEWLDEATGVPNAAVRGVHLRLPGHGESGPTLEIFTYDEVAGRPQPVANGAGYGHVAFEVDDVPAALQRMLDHGGSALGSVVRTTVDGAGELELTYARDPEGNIVELQSWTR
jgi:catechol 2,3-dioxygenase-like lactoylglutathione lyase family enzyme